MEFFIKKSEEERLREAYVLTLELGHGDADFNSKFEIGEFFARDEDEGDTDEWLLEEYITFLNQTLKECREPETYHNIPGFNRLFNQRDLTEEEWENVPSHLENITRPWPIDAFYDRPAKLLGYELIFYDIAGHPCEVEIKY